MINASEITKSNNESGPLSPTLAQTELNTEARVGSRKPRYSYQATLESAQQVNWQIEDIIGDEQRLDFAKRFMPESLAQVEKLGFLTADEKRTLNQIRGNAYLSIFGLVEEFIVPFVLDQSRPQAKDDDYRVRALLQFAGEEAKHIQLFKRFRKEFEWGFGFDCAVIGPPEAIAQAVLSHEPLAVALTILHIEWMVQRHYVESVRDDKELDPLFKSLLKHHWMEEVQHAKLDTLMIEAMSESYTPVQVKAAVEEYLEIGAFIDSGLKQQVQFDLDAFMRATGRKLSEEQKDQFMGAQLQANRWTYLGSAMTHERVLETLESLSSWARRRVEEIAPMYC